MVSDSNYPAISVGPRAVTSEDGNSVGAGRGAAGPRGRPQHVGPPALPPAPTPASSEAADKRGWDSAQRRLLGTDFAAQQY